MNTASSNNIIIAYTSSKQCTKSQLYHLSIKGESIEQITLNIRISFQPFSIYMNNSRIVKSGKYLLKSDHLGPFLFVQKLIYGTYLKNTNFKRPISKEHPRNNEWYGHAKLIQLINNIYIRYILYTPNVTQIVLTRPIFSIILS